MERENTPDFIHDFSKENDQVGRDETARQIKEKRSEHFARLEQEKQTQEKIIQLETRLAELDNGWIRRFLNRLEISKANDGLETLESVDVNQEDELVEAKEILTNYYQEQKESWSKAGFDETEIKRYFTEENLESLNLEDYGLLMSRFPSEMATHVTRQGVRDHTSMNEHRAGLDQFANGFVNILKDGWLRSQVGKVIVSEKKDEVLGDYFKWYVGQVREHCPWFKQNDREIIEHMIDKENMGEQIEYVDKGGKGYYRSPRQFSDSSAIHLAKDVVLDSYYGSEKGNEYFFAYPMAHLFAEHEFTNTSGGIDKHNDLWLWTKEQKGLSVDSAITFIPKSTQVDRNTGSRYKLDHEKNPIIAQKRLDESEKLFSNEDFIKYLQSLYIASEKQHSWEFKDKEKYQKELIEKFSVSDHRLIEAVLSSSFDICYKSYFNDRNNKLSSRTTQDLAEELLRSNYCYLQEAEDTITAEEYWEEFFKTNPELKPSKIVYYDGSPTRALEDWKRENKILSYDKPKFDDKFSDYLYGEEGEKHRFSAAIQGFEEYRDLCLKVLNKYFPEGEIQ